MFPQVKLSHIEQKDCGFCLNQEGYVRPTSIKLPTPASINPSTKVRDPRTTALALRPHPLDEVILK